MKDKDFELLVEDMEELKLGLRRHIEGYYGGPHQFIYGRNVCGQLTVPLLSVVAALVDHLGLAVGEIASQPARVSLTPKEDKSCDE